MLKRLFWVFAAVLVVSQVGCAERFVRPATAPADVRGGPENRAVTALSEDCESVRLALGAGWDHALAARAFDDYLADWTDDHQRKQVERLIARGVELYELLDPIDHGIQSVRFARDTRDAEDLDREIEFWRNELALAAGEVNGYVDDARGLRQRLADRLRGEAGKRGIRAERIAGRPWNHERREAWREAGPKTGVRLPLRPDPDSQAAWWNETLSVGPMYIAQKLRAAGEDFFTPEVPVGAWGHNAVRPGEYDWEGFDDYLDAMADRDLPLLLELPTLHATMGLDALAEQEQRWLKRSAWIWDRYAPPLPASLIGDDDAALQSLNDDGEQVPYGGVQLFDPVTARSYGDYLRDLAGHLKATGRYDLIAAIHLERGGWAVLPESVDYSDHTLWRWREFMKGRWRTIDALNEAAHTDYPSFGKLPLPKRTLDPRVAEDWAQFLEESNRHDGRRWRRWIVRKYGSEQAVRDKYGDDYFDGYGGRLPMVYPPVIGIDYLHFRREWVTQYMQIKRDLIARAFPDKLIIYEQRQFGDHDEIQGKSEAKWGGFIGNDIGVWSGTGPDHDEAPFMIRNIQPVGFGTRPSDAIESIYRDYLWLNFTDPGNLARYFYDWVAHGYLDYQLGWHSITNHWLSNHDVYEVGHTVANTKPAVSDIAMLLPRMTYDLHAGKIYDGFLGWNWMLHAAKLPYTRVDEDWVREGGLQRHEFEVLILPDVRAMDEAIAEQIAAFVERGGTLIATGLPGKVDMYGTSHERPLLNDVLGVKRSGHTSAAVADTPLTVTIPRGVFTGNWAQRTDRKPRFETFDTAGARVVYRYATGEPAITMHTYGEGTAVACGYPVGREAVIADRTSVGFGRTYTAFVREPQLVARVTWLRETFEGIGGYDAPYAVDYAEVARWEGKEQRAMSLSVLEGFPGQDDDYFLIKTLGDPREGREVAVVEETPDMAIRFFPRDREGVDTRYLGISTREVHYIAPRGTVNMHLARHSYRCRINDPSIQAIWDVARDVPVGFSRDARGVSFTVQVPSGHLVMLAVSRSPEVELFDESAFPGRTKAEVVRRARYLAGGKAPQPLTIFDRERIGPWLASLAEPAAEKRKYTEKGGKETVLISYGEPRNRPAGRKLAAFLRDRFDLDAEAVEQTARVEKTDRGDQKTFDYDRPVILIGDVWNNNDWALNASHWNWGGTYGPHMPLVPTYRWPGEDRAVVALSRRYALIDERGRTVGHRFNHQRHDIRPVAPTFQNVRRRLLIAANGDEAGAAVEALIELLQ